MKFVKIKTGDLMQVHERQENGVTYGSIFILLKTRHTQLDDAEAVLAEFLHQLQPNFAIQHSAGMAFLKTRQRCTITDYWRDAEDLDWKVQAETDGIHFSVRYIKNINGLHVGHEDLFLSRQDFSGC